MHFRLNHFLYQNENVYNIVYFFLPCCLPVLLSVCPFVYLCCCLPTFCLSTLLSFFLIVSASCSLSVLFSLCPVVFLSYFMPLIQYHAMYPTCPCGSVVFLSCCLSILLSLCPVVFLYCCLSV